MTPSLPDFAVWFTDQAERVVAHEKRAVEAREWAARLEPKCGTCTGYPERIQCQDVVRRMPTVQVCNFFQERPEVAREREIAAAAFEALTAEVH
jgi:hypothetical protein